MKKYSILIFLFIAGVFLSSSEAFANQNALYDYTYIDCENGSDSTGTGGGVPFDSTKPYLSLKKGLESTIAFINNNGLTDPNGTGAYYTHGVFNIHVKGGCFYNGVDGNSINLDFAGYDNDNYLRISGENGNFVIDNIYFNLTKPNSGNIIFANTNFWRNDLTGFYFSGFNSGYDSMNGSGIKIRDSLININNGKQIMNYNDSYSRQRYCGWYYNNIRPGGFYIENSLINAYINSDYWFRLPIFVKNNKINIKNSNKDGVKFNVGFYVAGNNREGFNYGSTNLIANEIDLGGNNFLADNTNSSFINNKFTNAGNFTVGTDETTTKYNAFINNQVQANNQVNITNNESAFNNVFINGFIDTRDQDNFKRNFSGSTNLEKGIGWLFRKDISSVKTINSDYKILYKEITGNDLPATTNPLFIIVH
ncbi:MAG: hypothetical protein PHR68_02855 [Candidatus Gracilibacteria bacterium]|nr:hypothetical protein [Candidatus Gracilibacteria bacterium]